jgi:hypothetical protein
MKHVFNSFYFTHMCIIFEKTMKKYQYAKTQKKQNRF